MCEAKTQTSSINLEALEPLYEPWEEPNAHRIKVKEPGFQAKIERGRRPSRLDIVQNLRYEVREWRESFYATSSETTKTLLNYWFESSHRKKSDSGEDYPFRYYFLQREAIETMIYLLEVRQIKCLSQLIHEFGGMNREIDALGVAPEEDEWARYAFKLATGTGKTKVMSLAIVWSYFHALRESNSEMTKHFVVIAPNLTVYERLKEDIGNGDDEIFNVDPLIPPEWKGDWNVTTVLQDSASGAVTGGVIYLTNIHRLYDLKKRKAKKNAEMYSFAGPTVSKATALDTGELLRDRITAHRSLMVLNDEAHHVWDPDSAWSEAVRYLHETIRSRTGGGLIAQLDFSATPKDNNAQLFKHIICESPLGEATDAGIVKIPIIGRTDTKYEIPEIEDASIRYQTQLLLGYDRWKASHTEWEKSGKKALMFVMCEDTDAANQITKRLETDPLYSELNGKVINLHTKLKGKVVWKGKGDKKISVFQENDKEISDNDLKVLRKISRELDQNSSQYLCIVSVLMLREGWDVKNVTTIVPLRPYSSKANILPEQTLGRGLRRMTVPGSEGANEILTVIDHPAFASLYQQELSQEGVTAEIVDVDRIPVSTITIFPDELKKDLKKLEIEIPTLAPGYKIIPKLDRLTVDDVKKEFSKYSKLPLGKEVKTEIQYEGQHLITGEVIERMKINLPLLESGIGAISYFVKQFENICKVRGIHKNIAQLLQFFIEEVLFDQKTDLFDQTLISRLSDSDVAEHIRAVFIPLIRKNTTTVEERTPAGEPNRLSSWKAFQVTHSERKPALEAEKTLFNLVPCNRKLEVAMTEFANLAPDVAAFAKNAGSQCLRIDYLADGGRLAFYTPDFFIRTTSGKYFLVETKGREDRDVPKKAIAAIEWCKSASLSSNIWEYLYVPQKVFEAVSNNTIEELSRTCAPALKNLVEQIEFEDRYPLFAKVDYEEEDSPEILEFASDDILKNLPERYAKAISDSVILYKFTENKKEMSFAGIFASLFGIVEESAKGLIHRRLEPSLPDTVQDQKYWFKPYTAFMRENDAKYYESMAQNLKRTLVFKNGFSPLGLLRSCLEYASRNEPELEGVFEAIRENMRFTGSDSLLKTVARMNDFRNSKVVHRGEELIDPKVAGEELKHWIHGIWEMVKS